MSEENATSWHQISSEKTALKLGVNQSHGLRNAEVSVRTAKYGANQIQEQQSRGSWQVWLAQFSDFMIWVLLAAAAISGLLGELSDALAIAIIVMLNGVLGFFQELRAEQAIAALREMGAPHAKVLREGQWHSIPATDLVPGDVVMLEAGDIVPADLRLWEVADLRVDESALTGESQPVFKHVATLTDGHSSPGERLNLAFRNTLVNHGRAQGLVIATGMQSEIGKIAQMLGGAKRESTPLQKRLNRFGKRLAIIVLVICALIFALGLIRGEPVLLMFLTAVSLAVAAIPEALPAVVTIALALGARRMVKHNALVRNLPAVETLGSVTYICSDKTGTLTQNRMRAARFYAAGDQKSELPASGELWNELARSIANNNDAVTSESGETQGDPTEIALLEAAANKDNKAPRIGELPFESTRKRMTTFHQSPKQIIAYTKGAPETVLPACRAGYLWDEFSAQRVLTEAESLAAQGFRVLAFARRVWQELPAEMDAELVESKLEFLGLVALIDPLREEAAAAVAECRTAGITPVMITGDHAATALAIAKQVGIATDDSRVITGDELAQHDGHPPPAVVYARVSPAQKIDIVKSLKARGEFVAMTGDGVNDAPALKSADIGVAMGQKGTAVAREASDMILLDDNFATIVGAVREGRRIYDNVRLFIQYTLTSNAGEIWTLLLAPFLGLPMALLPIQILWINLVTDGLPGLAMVLEPASLDVMKRKPRAPDESIFARGLWQHVLWCGLLIGLLSLAAPFLITGLENGRWQTAVFTVLTFSQLVHAFAIRGGNVSVFSGRSANPALIGALIFTALLQIVVIYLPLAQSLFKTQALSLNELALCMTLPWVVLIGVEIEKWLVRRGWIYRGIAVPTNQ